MKTLGSIGIISVEGSAAGDTVEAPIANAKAHREFVRRAIA